MVGAFEAPPADGILEIPERIVEITIRLFRARRGGMLVGVFIGLAQQAVSGVGLNRGELETLTHVVSWEPPGENGVREGFIRHARSASVLGCPETNLRAAQM